MASQIPGRLEIKYPRVQVGNYIMRDWWAGDPVPDSIAALMRDVAARGGWFILNSCSREHEGRGRSWSVVLPGGGQHGRHVGSVGYYIQGNGRFMTSGVLGVRAKL